MVSFLIRLHCLNSAGVPDAINALIEAPGEPVSLLRLAASIAYFFDTPGMLRCGY